MPYTSIREIADELHAGIITPTELVYELFERIDEVEGQVQAFTTLLREQAMRDAEQSERELRTGLYRSQLHGVPIAIKDLIAVQGVNTSASSQVLTDNIALEDAAVIEQLRRNGAIIIGKTNTFEFAYGPYAPPTRNPWDYSRTTGGSSGGSAAAVAAGMCLGAIGTDTGGSIRIPAACCGVTGLKPTYGRVSCYGVIPLSWTLDHVGPIGHSAEDCAIIFDAIAKYDPRDPNSVSGPPTTPNRYTTILEGVEGRGPLSLQGLKIGVPQDDFVNPLDPEVRRAWRAALLVLQEEGIEIINVDLPRPDMDLYRTIQKPEAALAHMQKGWFPERSSAYGDLVRTRLSEGQQIPAINYLAALHERRQLSSNFRAALQRVDAFILPTIPTPAILASQAGQIIKIDGVQEEATTAYLRLTMPFNITGLPSISFPAGFNAAGLPIGLQIAGKPFEEATILRIAHAYQQLTDWHRRDLPDQA
ncbi:amidase [Dictyobacter arantiisoli]|uniref:Amidase n=1 Tax=Dictyobacter arantiisoli TaxID=2014874 RepID=A0A5A5T7H2_9CHLR|nr:amidase [Dictyobacter arantiisoli]GCF07205.1 amidase [Dictyobacter arantiisoli]